MPDLAPPIWQVGALCRAIADVLEARLNPVAVRGEISGFSRASSGHCYFSLRDQVGQIRCVMFKRASGVLGFVPRDGAQVEVRGRLGLYEPRGDLQLIVESMAQTGAGALFEQFLRVKARLEAEGLFDQARKRSLPPMPRGIGVVTSLGAAALHDVVTALQRRAPHIPVVVAPASVQGGNAAGELCAALAGLYQLALAGPAGRAADGAMSQGAPALAIGVPLDAILLVRGGGSMEDLSAFNDEVLARLIARSPVPLVSGVGHETDFTIADFVADVRAPTPTAAAEVVAQSRDVSLAAIGAMQGRLGAAFARRLDTDAQRIDRAAARLARPSTLVAAQRAALAATTQRLSFSVRSALRQHGQGLRVLRGGMPAHFDRALARSRSRLERAELRLGMLDPSLVLQRGYALLTDEQGRTITRPDQTRPGQVLHATMAEGSMDLLVPARS